MLSEIRTALVDVYMNENPKREQDIFDLMADAALRTMERPVVRRGNIIPPRTGNTGKPSL